MLEKLLVEVEDVDIFEMEESEQQKTRIQAGVEATPCGHQLPLHRRRYKIRPMDLPQLQVLVPRPIEEELDPKLVSEEGRRAAVDINPDDVAEAVAAAKIEKKQKTTT